MTTIITVQNKDAVKQAVEAQSGGKQTVLFTAKGQPSYVNIVKKKTFRELNPNWDSDATHPAFIINGVEKDMLYVGTYEGTIVNGELISIPNANRSNSSIQSLWTAAKLAGPNWHVMTLVEHIMLVALSFLEGDGEPQGNTNGIDNFMGYSSYDNTQMGRRGDGADPLTAPYSAPILSGSGPVSFRHSQDFNGISDLVGNYFDHGLGCRIIDGEIQIYHDNDLAAVSSDNIASALLSTVYSDGAGWQAANATAAGYITPTFTGTAGTNYTATTASIRLVEGTANVGSAGFALANGNFGAVNSASSIVTNVPAAAKHFAEALGIIPPASLDSQGKFKYNNGLGYAIDSAIRARNIKQYGAIGGTFTATMSDSVTKNSLGGRPVYYPD